MYISGFVVDTSVSGLSRDVSSLLNEYTIKETLFAAVMSSFQAQFIRQLILSVRSAFLGVEVWAGVNVYTRVQMVGVNPSAIMWWMSTVQEHDGRQFYNKLCADFVIFFNFFLIYCYFMPVT